MAPSAGELAHADHRSRSNPRGAFTDVRSQSHNNGRDRSHLSRGRQREEEEDDDGEEDDDRKEIHFHSRRSPLSFRRLGGRGRTKSERSEKGTKDEDVPHEEHGEEERTDK